MGRIVRLGRPALGILGIVLIVVVCYLFLSGFGYIGLHSDYPATPTKLPTPTIPYTPAPLARNTEWQVDRAIRADLAQFFSTTDKGWHFYQNGHQLLLIVTVDRKALATEIRRLADVLVSALRSVVDQYEQGNEGRRYYSYTVRVATPSGGISAEAFLPRDTGEVVK